MMIYLSCTECGVEARLPDGNKILIESFDHLVETLQEWNTTSFQFASSMHFPEENTSDPEVLKLVEEIMEKGLTP
jgi:hypothetical protein